MNSDPADTVYTTGMDADAANPGDQPHPVLNKNADSSQSERPSAIERQRAMQPAVRRNRTDQITQPPPPRSRFAAFFDGLYNSDGSRFGGPAALALLLSAVSLLSMLSTFLVLRKETVPQAESAQITKTLQKIPASGASSEMDATNAIAVPIGDVSLRVRPELLQQLVAIYRLRLVTDPDNSAATATLSRMREHSLAELDVISATESAPLAGDSLRLAAKLFPELANDQRYRSIAARINTTEKNTTAQSLRPVASAPAAVAQQPATQRPAPQPAPATTPSLSTSPATPVPPPTPASISKTQPPATPLAPPATPASISTTQSPAAVASRKPQIRVNSVTPGIIRKDRFVPADGGNVFRLNIDYRHRDKPLVNEPGAGLVAQLSESGSSKLLAEVPVDIAGSSGKKIFLIDTSAKGKMGKFYKLNFIVDGHVLPSHTVQLMPAGFAGL